MILKVLDEEETGDESSSIGGGGDAAAAEVSTMGAATVQDAAAAAASGPELAAVEVAIPEEGGPGAPAMLNLESVKVETVFCFVYPVQ